MVLNLIDQRIRRAFSNAALQYDALTGLHKEIGRELIRKIDPPPEGGKLLDIGMGTGWLTSRIKGLYPDCQVVGLDFAEGMVKAAQDHNDDFRILQADAGALPFKAETFDAIVSNFAFQWLSDLPRSFQLCRGTLKPGGQLCVTMFGRDTFHELFEALEHARGAGGALGIHRLYGKGDVEKALRNAGFEDAQITTESIKVRFPDMMGIVKWTKEIGANILERDFYVGKDLLARAGEYYDKNFKDHLGIYTTFEVIWVLVRK